NPKKAIFTYYMGKIAIQRGQKKSAIGLFKKAVKIQPEFFQGTLALGLIYEEGKDFKNAISVYENFLEKVDESNFAILSRIVQVYFVMNDQLSAKSRPAYKVMVPYVERLTSLDPSDLNLKVRLGILYADAKKYFKAIGVFKEILVAVPDSDKVNFYLGTLYQVLGESDNAISHFSTIQPDSPLYVDGHLQIAKILNVVALEKLKNKDEAGAKRFVKFIKSMEGKNKELDFELTIQLAGFYEARGDIRGAINAVDDLQEKGQLNENQIFYLASLYDKIKKFRESESLMEKLLEKDPENAHALNFLGYSILERGGNLEVAYKYISKAVELKPEDGYIRDSLGWYYYKVGEFEKALIEISKAQELVSNDVVITKHLAIVHKKLENFEEAKKFYLKALAQCKTEEERQDVIRDLSGLEKVRLPAEASN
ncbi:MAG: tetratricopeptide repeat protein, partial [Bacteriovoracaceae bacterium]